MGSTYVDYSKSYELLHLPTITVPKAKQFLSTPLSWNVGPKSFFSHAHYAWNKKIKTTRFPHQGEWPVSSKFNKHWCRRSAKLQTFDFSWMSFNITPKSIITTIICKPGSSNSSSDLFKQIWLGWVNEWNWILNKTNSLYLLRKKDSCIKMPGVTGRIVVPLLPITETLESLCCRLLYTKTWLKWKNTIRVLIEYNVSVLSFLNTPGAFY